MRWITCLLAMVVALTVGTPLQAAQFLYSVTGIVVGEEFTIDDFGLFNPLQGDSFTAEFLVDDSSPLSLYGYGTSGSSASGGAIVQFGTRTPVTSLLQIGGNSYAIRTGDHHSYPTTDSVGDPVGPTDITEEQGTISKDAALGRLSLIGNFSQSHSCCFPHPNDSYGESDYLEFNLYSSGLSDPDYRQTGTFALSPASFGYFQKSETIVSYLGRITNLVLRPQNLTVMQVSAVPELGTWLMMILGIGIAGLAVRGRRSATGRIAAWSSETFVPA